MITIGSDARTPAAHAHDARLSIFRSHTLAGESARNADNALFNAAPLLAVPVAIAAPAGTMGADMTPYGAHGGTSVPVVPVVTLVRAPAPGLSSTGAFASDPHLLRSATPA